MDPLCCRAARRGRSTRDLRSSSISDPDEDDDEKERDELCMRLGLVGDGMVGTESTEVDAMSL